MASTSCGLVRAHLQHGPISVEIVMYEDHMAIVAELANKYGNVD